MFYMHPYLCFLFHARLLISSEIEQNGYGLKIRLLIKIHNVSCGLQLKNIYGKYIF